MFKRPFLSSALFGGLSSLSTSPSLLPSPGVREARGNHVRALGALCVFHMAWTASSLALGSDLWALGDGYPWERNRTRPFMLQTGESTI